MTQDANHSISLRVDGREYTAWQGVGVSRHVDSAAGEFELALPWRHWTNGDSPRIRAGQACEVQIGVEAVLVGWVEVARIEAGADSATFSVMGRAKTCDLIDCSAHVFQFRQSTILDIARTLAAPYDVEVILDPAIPPASLTRLHAFKLEVGESIWSALERLAREQALLVTDDRYGRLYLGRAGAHKGDTLRMPGQIVSISGEWSNAARYSHYRIAAQTVADDQNAGRYSAGVEGGAFDPVGRYRLLIQRGEKAMSPGQAEARAVWEAVTRAGRSCSLSVSVRGWRDSQGHLYEHNAVHDVQIPDYEIDAEFLAAGVSYHWGEDGPATTLELIPPGAFVPEPPVKQAASKRGAVTGAKRGPLVSGKVGDYDTGVKP